MAASGRFGNEAQSKYSLLLAKNCVCSPKPKRIYDNFKHKRTIFDSVNAFNIPTESMRGSGVGGYEQNNSY